MFSNNDSIGKTFFVVIALCLVCAIFVATSAVQLRPKQTENKLLDAQKNILVATGLLSGDNVKELFTKHIQERLVDMNTGEFVDMDPAKYDYRKAMKDAKLSDALVGADDPASIKRRAKIAPVYLAYNDGVESGKLSAIVLPVHGYGLWSTLYGFIAIKGDLNTVVGFGFYQHGETPGLGGEVDNPKWKALWAGKTLFDEQGQLAVEIIKGSVDPQSAKATHEVDGLAGATLTSKGVNNLLHFWLGESGFGPLLANIKKGEA